MVTASEIALWERMIGASWDDLPAETARGILQLTFSDKDVARMSELSERSSDMPLPRREQAELEQYALVARILTLMHSRARRALGSAPATAAAKSAGRRQRKSK